MAPPRVPNAFAAESGERWSFAWIRYDEPASVIPMVDAASPVRTRHPAGGLILALQGFRQEWESRRDPPAIHHWTSLVHHYARHLAGPARLDPRLRRLWTAVSEDLAADWNLHSLARQCHLSREHLRRLCLLQLGRSPVQQLASLRLQRAQELLESTADKLETIAASIGYESALVFSRAFKRRCGCSPSEYRNPRSQP